MTQLARLGALVYVPVLAGLSVRPELRGVIVRLLAVRLRATDEVLAGAVVLEARITSPVIGSQTARRGT